MTAQTAGPEAKPENLAASHAGAVQRAAIVAERLRGSARALRDTYRKTAARPRWAVSIWLGYQSYSWFQRSRARLFGFLILFGAPALLVVGYFSLWASNQYTSEARFAVRNSEQVPIDAIAGLTGLASVSQVQDSLIVVNYLKSQAFVEALDRQVDLRSMFGRRDIDWLSRFDASGPIEDLVKYWKWHIKTSVEAPSGIIVVAVSAFSPDDALKIAAATIDLSERLVNGLSNRARQDAVKEAQTELTRAEERLTNARVSLRDLRNQQATLDPQRSAEGIGRLISELRLEKLRLEQELTAAKRGNVSDSAPQAQVMHRRLDVIDEQISGLEQLLTSQDDSQHATMAGKMTRFDDLELEQQIAEKQYTLAAAALERARVNAEGQKVYLATFVQPVLPMKSTYPKRILSSLVGTVAVFLLYLVSLGVWAAARPRLAV